MEHEDTMGMQVRILKCSVGRTALVGQCLSMYSQCLSAVEALRWIYFASKF